PAALDRPASFHPRLDQPGPELAHRLGMVPPLPDRLRRGDRPRRLAPAARGHGAADEPPGEGGSRGHRPGTQAARKGNGNMRLEGTKANKGGGRLLLLGMALALAGCARGRAPGQPSEKGEVADPREVVDFAPLYATNCAGCHGVR